MIVQRCHEHRHVGVLLLVDTNAFRRGDQGEKQDVFSPHAAILQDLHRMGGGVAGADHRIAEDENAAIDFRQAHQVLDRPVILVAVEPDMPDPG